MCCSFIANRPSSVKEDGTVCMYSELFYNQSYNSPYDRNKSLGDLHLVTYPRRGDFGF